VTNKRVSERAALGLILLVALAWRLNNVGFGLPSMYDPDEPIFMIKALHLLADRTLNPGWFGHPGSTTIYLVALIDAAIAWSGLLLGRYADVSDFAHAAYANPALLFIPARTAMALLGLASVWLTYTLGRRLFGPAIGLVGAAFLAINGLHIAWSQVIRTDIHASVFMLASLVFAARAAEKGALRDYLWAGIFAGFAIATKWPAATAFIAVLGASAYGLKDRGWRPAAAGCAASFAALLAAIFIASPYIFLDWQTVLANVSGEVKTGHLAHSGHGFFGNLAYYLGDPVAGSMGWIGLLLSLAGLAIAAARNPVARWTLVPVAAAFLALICTQGLVWSRWVLPVMPMFCLFAAIAVVGLGRLAGRAIGWPGSGVALATILALVPSGIGAVAQARERAGDTRIQAARWLVSHVPPGSTVTFEHLELSLRHQPWRILFPVGDAGCIDGKRALATGVRYENVERLRRGSPIVDLGNVNPDRLGSCRGDFALLTYYDLYLQEAGHYPREVATYRRLLAHGKTVALFAPRPGRAGGPVVRIVALPPQ
jgi:hypothetical protein